MRIKAAKARLIYQTARNAFVRKAPFLLYLKPTARCNLRCKSCNRWQEDSAAGDELSLPEIEEILRKFRRAGCTVFTLWGGEPTIRRDLPEMLAAAKRMGYRTSMCTNGLLLPRKAESVFPNLDVLLCSLDGVGRTHDEFRGVDGLFDKVTEALRIAASRGGCYTKIWAGVHRNNLHELRQMAEHAGSLGAGIEFFPIARIAGYNDELVLDADQRREAFGRIIDLKREGLPVRNPLRALRILRHSRPFTCNFGRIAIFVDHQGNVHTCEDPAGAPIRDWCNYREFDPDTVFSSREFEQTAERLKRCNICTLPCMLELSGNLSLRLPELLFSPERWEERSASRPGG